MLGLGPAEALLLVGMRGFTCGLTGVSTCGEVGLSNCTFGLRPLEDFGGWDRKSYLIKGKTEKEARSKEERLARQTNQTKQ